MNYPLSNKIAKNFHGVLLINHILKFSRSSFALPYNFIFRSFSLPRQVTSFSHPTLITQHKRFTGSKKGFEKAAKILSTESPTAIRPIIPTSGVTVPSPGISPNTSANNLGINPVKTESEKSLIATTSLKFNSIQDKIPHPEEKESNINFNIFSPKKTNNFLETENLPAVEQKLNEDLTKTAANFVAGYTEGSFLVVNSTGTIDSIKEDEPHALVGTVGENNSLTLLGYLTSSKGHSATTKTPNNIQLSETKVDGKFYPQITSRSSGMDDDNNKLPLQKSRLINDDFGNAVSDPKRGGQFFRVFPEERILIEEEQKKLGFEIDASATEFINSDKVLPKIKKLAQKNESKDKAIIFSFETCNEIALEENAQNIENDID